MLAFAVLGSACTPLGPDYVRPEVDLPTEWKSAPGVDPSEWKQAQPADALPKYEWWTVFGDQQLNTLETRSLDGNLSLQAAVTRLDQALAQSDFHAAALVPSVQAGGAASRLRISANRPKISYTTPTSSTVQNDLRPVLSVNYEFDWLGKIRRNIESAHASAQQAEADKENMRLLVTAQVATVYFQLRQTDEEIEVLSASAALQEKVLQLITTRYELGAAARGDLLQQASLTDSTRAQLELLKAHRDQQENALATLTGMPAAGFRLAPGKLPIMVPSLPLTVPSSLLERRPDIAAAERAMAAANAQIGVAQAAYYPTLSLTPTYGGYESTNLDKLLGAPSLIWSLGVSASQSLYDGGRIKANVDFAKAGYAGAVANYRQSVLIGIQEVQDALGNLQELGLAQQRQDKAVQNQVKTYQVHQIRYKEGLDNSFTLATTEQNLLGSQRVQSQIRGSQFLAAVSLVKALGGGWAMPSSTPDVTPEIGISH
ncbi:MAG: efflux transporter outer membrane subunit [Chlorobium sp.]|nr:efflux transporter outer membrane subunit [Chlorobium sp.]